MGNEERKQHKVLLLYKSCIYGSYESKKSPNGHWRYCSKPGHCNATIKANFDSFLLFHPFISTHLQTFLWAITVMKGQSCIVYYCVKCKHSEVSDSTAHILFVCVCFDC